MNRWLSAILFLASPRLTLKASGKAYAPTGYLRLALQRVSLLRQLQSCELLTAILRFPHESAFGVHRLPVDASWDASDLVGLNYIA